MWTQQTNPQVWAACFRRNFTLPNTGGFHRIIILADNFSDVYINGHYLGLADWPTQDTFCIPSSFLNVGNNVIALKVGEYTNTATYVSVLATFNNPQPYPCTVVPCNDTCAWTVTGNNVLGTRNVFGTLSNDNVRIFTNGISRGVFTNTGRFGFGTPTPGNRVEINHSGDGTSSNTGFSGLRFSNMNIFSNAQNNQGKVLSVDANGDVVLVTDGGGGGAGNANNGCSMDGSGTVQLGQSCEKGSGAELLDNRTVPMNSNNFTFSDGSMKPFTNRVGIGISSCVPNAKLDVVRNIEDEAYDQTNIAISGTNLDRAREGEAIGVYGESSLGENLINTGGSFLGRAGRKITHGVVGIGLGRGEGDAFGGWFSACEAKRNIGVYGEACESDNKGNGPNYAGYFNGDVFSVTGYFASDKKIKKNIEPIVNALELLNKIQPKKYQFDNTVFPTLNLPVDRENYGVIAQDLEQVLPSLVKETPVPDGNKGMLDATIKTVNYTELIPILIQAVKDQQVQIRDQQTKIDELTAAVKNVAGNTRATDNGQSGISMDQNVPNPCDNATTIGFNIAASVQTAVITLATMEGKVIRAVTLNERGKSSVRVITSDINSGTYIYTLTADGKIIDSKKMVVNK